MSLVDLLWRPLFGSAPPNPPVVAADPHAPSMSERVRLGSPATAMAQRFAAPTQPTHRIVREESSTEEIVATRGWRLGFSPYVGVRLWSLCRDVIWEGPTLVAHADPEGDWCGIHAAKDEEWADRFAEYASIANVWGIVALSGKVVEGATGYQAERATIQSLVLHSVLGRHSDEVHSASNELFRRRVEAMPCFTPAPSSDLPNPYWPGDVSVFDALNQLAERYQCEVTLAPSLTRVS